MSTNNSNLYKAVSEQFAMGKMELCLPYLSEDIRWNILGNSPVFGKQQVLEIFKMQQLESFPVITITNIVSEGNFVVVESTGKAKTKKGTDYNQTYCDVFRFNNEMLEEITTYLDTALSNEVSG